MRKAKRLKDINYHAFIRECELNVKQLLKMSHSSMIVNSSSHADNAKEKYIKSWNLSYDDKISKIIYLSSFELDPTKNSFGVCGWIFDFEFKGNKAKTLRHIEKRQEFISDEIFRAFGIKQ